MGGHSNLQGVKLSDFIDEDFLNDLVLDSGSTEYIKKSDKKPLEELLTSTLTKSTILLPTLTTESTLPAGNKRRRADSSGDF